jgi:hypothetical protein
LSTDRQRVYRLGYHSKRKIAFCKLLRSLGVCSIKIDISTVEKEKKAVAVLITSELGIELIENYWM